METDFSIDRLLAFIDELPDSFAQGPRERVAVRELILRLIDGGEMPSDPRLLRTLLAPVVCSTPDQQREFYDRFETWVAPDTEREEKRHIPVRRWPWIAVAALLIASACAGGYVIRSIGKIPPPPLPPVPGLPPADSGSSNNAGVSDSIQGEVVTLDGLPRDLQKANIRLPVGVAVKPGVLKSGMVTADRTGRFQVSLVAGTTAAGQSTLGAFSETLRISTGSVLYSLCLSPNGRRIATAGNDKTPRLWDAATGKELLALRGHTSVVETVACSPDGKYLATASDDTTARVWDAVTGKELFTLSGHNNFVWTVAFSPDGRRLATVSSDDTAKVWDAETGQELLTLRGHTSSVHRVVFSPDGRRLATASSDQTVRVWDAATGKELLTLRGPRGFWGVAFSPDGRFLATGSDDQTVRVWEANTGRELLTLRGHTGIVSYVVFSPDGKRIATASYDKTARVWDTTTGKELLILRGHTDIVYGVAFSPDGRSIATASADKTVRVWEERGLSNSSAEAGLNLLVTHPDYEPAYIENVHRGGFATARLGDLKSSELVFVRRVVIAPRRYPLWVSVFLGLAVASSGLIAFLNLRRQAKERQALLEKWETHLDLNPASIYSRSEEDLLFAGPEFAAMAQQLRRPGAEPTSDLAVDMTVLRTVERAGVFTPVRRLRKSGREYLALLESKGRYDQQARFWKCFLRRLSAYDVWLDSFQFAGDPRSCRGSDADPSVTQLEELSSVHPGHALWVVTETERFFDRVTREPAPWVPALARWQERGVFGLSGGTHEDRRHLDQLGFGFVSGNPVELARVSDTTGPHSGEPDADYPSALLEDEARWLHGPEPRGASGRRELRSLDRQLRVWLGEPGYRCLLACAVYPGLAWNLTLHLSIELLPERELEHTVGRLIRLPWFRYSRMPQWLREFLLEQMPADEYPKLLDILEKFLEIKREPQTSNLEPSLEVLKITEPLKSAGKPPTRDYVFLSFLLRRSLKRSRVRAPQWLRDLLYPEGMQQLGTRPAIWLLIGVLGGGLAFAAAEHYAYPANRVTGAIWEEIVPPLSTTAAPVNQLSARALEIADSQLRSAPPPDFTNWVFERAAEFAGDMGIRRVGTARPGTVFIPAEKTEEAGLVEEIVPNGFILIQPLNGRICRVYRLANELHGRFEEIPELRRTEGVVSTGSAILKGTWGFDLDSGVEGGPIPNNDIWWDQQNAVIRTMTPLNSAKIINLGVIDFNAITPDTLSRLTYSTTPLDGNNDPSNKLVTGDVFAVLTTSGNYAKVKVLNYDYNMTIQWVTYHRVSP